MCVVCAVEYKTRNLFVDESQICFTLGMEGQSDKTSEPEGAANGSPAQQNEPWGTELLGYRWPATRLSRADMRQLKLASVHLRRPITRLLKEAVQSCARVLAREAETQSIIEKLMDEIDDDSLPEGEMTGEDSGAE